MASAQSEDDVLMRGIVHVHQSGGYPLVTTGPRLATAPPHQSLAVGPAPASYAKCSWNHATAWLKACSLDHFWTLLDRSQRTAKPWETPE